MTDRELLEAAARAAGVQGWWAYGRDYPEVDDMPWNPLTDIGDAARLMLALKLRVDYVGYQPCVDGVLQSGMTAEEAYCRAVVRAAAAMAEKTR